jgi:phosphatidylethanolamine/phosphatidyl-N-methylethanolamine N-methyltransferase
MSLDSARLFLSRFLCRPTQVASVVPSSKVLVNEVLSRMDLKSARTIVEFGPGEGVQTRELLQRVPEEARIILFELDEVLCESLKRQFQHDPRVTVLNEDALSLKQALGRIGIEQIDDVFSGIPFSLMVKEKKMGLLRDIYSLLQPGGAFVSYQVTRELNRFAGEVFDVVESKHCWWNVPPMYVSRYGKDAPPEAAGGTD